MLEFTGERVIPGLVDPNLLNEHLARYRFAARYAQGNAVLDAGCGSGYGTRELVHAASVTAMDIAHDALLHAAASYGRAGLRFTQGSLEALPFAEASFDLVLAFEVIEHLTNWAGMLREARRVLKPGGVLLVSTPNKSYYAESRGTSGPNPFHTHEFDYEEFREALTVVFPHVHLWTQNRTEALVFAPVEASAGTLDAPGDGAAGDAHFYLAACSAEPIVQTGAFAWLPESGNLLRVREHHIELLRQEIQRRDLFIRDLQASQSELMRAQTTVNLELQRANDWAHKLAEDLRTSGERIQELQNDTAAIHAGYQERIGILDHEAAVRLAWAADLESQIRTGDAEIERLQGVRLGLERELRERTDWAHALDEELSQTRLEVARLRAIQRAAASSKWIRTGRALNLGPVIEAE